MERSSTGRHHWEEHAGAAAVAADGMKNGANGLKGAKAKGKKH